MILSYLTVICIKFKCYTRHVLLDFMNNNKANLSLQCGRVIGRVNVSCNQAIGNGTQRNHVSVEE